MVLSLEGGTNTVELMRYFPRGNQTTPPPFEFAASIAFWIARWSSVAPSPFAPNARTSKALPDSVTKPAPNGPPWKLPEAKTAPKVLIAWPLFTALPPVFCSARLPVITFADNPRCTSICYRIDGRGVDEPQRSRAGRPCRQLIP